jgi:hypothetical protein
VSIADHDLPHLSAGGRSPFEDTHLKAARGQLNRGDESADAGADDDHFLCGHPMMASLSICI